MTKTILVVDDDDLVLLAVQELLTPLGFSVTTSSNGADAIQKATSKAFDLVILDVIMPEMNGKELQQHVEELSPGIKTLFISGYTADVVAERGILEKETFFMQKPFTPDALLRMVHTILSDTHSGVA